MGYKTYRILNEHFKLNHSQFSETLNRCSSILDKINEVIWEASDFTSYLHGKDFTELERDTIAETKIQLKQYIDYLDKGITLSKEGLTRAQAKKEYLSKFPK